MSVDTEERNDIYLELDINEPEGQLLKYAENNIGETPGNKVYALQELKEMIYERGDFLPQSMEERYLLKFLRPRNFNVEKSYNLMDRYFQFREENQDLVEGICPSDLMCIGDDGAMSVPPYYEQNGRRMLIYDIGNWDTTKYSIEEILKGSIVVLELAIMEPRTQILGGICIFDLRKLTMQHIWQLSPSIASKIVQLFGVSFPIRLHSLHVLHESWTFDAAFKLFKPFLSEKMAKKILFHGSDDMETFHSHIHPKHLPKSLGGYRPDYSYRDMLNKVIANETIVQDMKVLGYPIDKIKIYPDE